MSLNLNDGQPASVPTDWLTLREARSIVANSVLNLPSNTPRTVEIDESIQAAGEEFSNFVRPVRTTAQVTTTANEHDVVFTGDNYLHRRLIHARIIINGRRHPALHRVDDETISREIRDKEETGVPTRMAVYGSDTFTLYPIPDDEYTLEGVWWEPFVRFAFGTEDAENILLNIPRDMIHGVLNYGVPAYFERGSEKQRFVRDARALFEQHMRKCLGQIDDVASGVAYVYPDAR